MMRIALFLCLLIFSVNGCVTGQNNPASAPKTGSTQQAEGIGGTGQKLAEGIGGTGQKLAEGIGGTGQKVADGIGGTGIVGTVTDFGSIWIKHAHVKWNDSTVITEDGQPVSTDQFKLGHVVAVISDPLRKGYLARSIDIVHEVIGPIEKVEKGGKRLQILGQEIQLDKETLIFAKDGRKLSRAALSIGQVAKISGLRKAENTVLANRIDLVATTNKVQLIGKLEGDRLAGHPVNIDPALVYNADADRLRVTGTLENGVLIADEISQDSILSVIEQATDLLLEGFLFDQAFEGDIVVGGIELVLPDELDVELLYEMEEAIFIDAYLGEDDLFYTEDFLFIEDLLDFEFDPEEWIEE